MRRPPQLSDEYVYTPLTKQRSLHKDALKIRSPKIHLQRKRKVTEEQSSIARMRKKKKSLEISDTFFIHF
jgi:hypothetical protein